MTKNPLERAMCNLGLARRAQTTETSKWRFLSESKSTYDCWFCGTEHVEERAFLFFSLLQVAGYSSRLIRMTHVMDDCPAAYCQRRSIETVAILVGKSNQFDEDVRLWTGAEGCPISLLEKVGSEDWLGLKELLGRMPTVACSAIGFLFAATVWWPRRLARIVWCCVFCWCITDDESGSRFWFLCPKWCSYIASRRQIDTI